MHLFRIHIRPGGGFAGMKETFQYCLDEGVLGVGWRTNSNKNTTDWEEYFKEASPIHEKLNVCEYIKKWVGKNDLVWTRSTEGEYYLAKVISGWEYWVGSKAVQKDIDIANIFRVSFQKIPIDMVPGKIVACFRAPRSIQEIADHKALEYSKYLWNRLSNVKIYDVDISKFKDMFMMLNDEETEDVVFIYLQMQGWVVVPNSRKGDTMSYEFYAVNRETKEKAIVQVKTGHTPLSPKDWEKWKEKVFLFQANGKYNGSSDGNVICLKPDEIESFMYANKDILPSNISHWLDVAENEKKI